VLGDKFEVRGDGILITAAHPENLYYNYIYLYINFPGAARKPKQPSDTITKVRKISNRKHRELFLIALMPLQ
jgi:hypothetical protein